LPAPIEATIVRLKREYPGWGAPKIREKLRRQFTGASARDQHGVRGPRSLHLVNGGRRRRSTRAGTELSLPTEPKALWCVDYKGASAIGGTAFR
jgi:putative transposase